MYKYFACIAPNVVWAAAMALLVATPARADGVCVRCSGPDQIYSCSLAPEAAASAPRGKALQYRCVQEIAHSYGHQQCQVKQNDIGTCAGTVYMVTGVPVRPSPVRAPSVEAAAGRPAKPAAAPDEPATVVEMAKRAAGGTNEQIRRSAHSVSKAAKSTWRCLSTFFADC